MFKLLKHNYLNVKNASRYQKRYIVDRNEWYNSGLKFKCTGCGT